MKVENLSLLTGAVQNPLIISSGLIGYWSLNDGSGNIARDFCGNANFKNGTLTGTTKPTWAIGKVGGALSFNGAANSAYVNIPDSAYLRPGSGNWTICYWFNAPNANQFGTIVSKRDGGTFNQIQIGIGYINSGGSPTSTKSVYIFTYSGLTGFHTISDFADGTWHHAVVIRPSSGNPTIYIDGISQSLITDSNSGVANINTTVDWEIGYGNAGGGTYYNGLADEVRMYNRVLNQSEITALYLGKGP